MKPDVFTKTNEGLALLPASLNMHEACSYVPVWTLWHPCERQANRKGLPKQNKRSDVHAKGMNIALSRPGGHGGVAAPVPIPNTAVKRPSANGTSSQDAGE